ncbi:hypothetical protein ACMHYO_05155 [Allopusillimonas ginsengisoli]|uniref:hypothetical protein n=1 Tax=Allopusillimonas ginsengisoli TaxID=453575 RepID=UPI0039C417F5
MNKSKKLDGSHARAFISASEVNMKKRNQYKSCLLMLVQVLTSFLLLSAAQAQSWNGTITMQVASKQDPRTLASFSPSQFGATVPVGSVISGVNVSVSGSQADMVSLRTFVCHNETTRCVQALGKSFYTQAFNGLDASKPIYVSHEIIVWGTTFPPVFLPTAAAVLYVAP